MSDPDWPPLTGLGEEVEALTKDVMAQPKEVIDKLRKLMGS